MNSSSPKAEVARSNRAGCAKSYNKINCLLNIHVPRSFFKLPAEAIRKQKKSKFVHSFPLIFIPEDANLYFWLI